MPARHTITSVDELRALEDQVKASAVEATRLLRDALGGSDGIDVLTKVRFEPVGRDPLNANRPLNLVEQLNQTFSHMVMFQATKYLFKHHSNHAPFILALGAISGHDIASANGKVIAEAFAAVSPKSNGKLKKDVAKLLNVRADHKYVFYYCPGYPKGVTDLGQVKAISLGQI